jgi:hypothetical protein
MNRYHLEMDGALLRLEDIRKASGLIYFTFSTQVLNVLDTRVPQRPTMISPADLQRMVKYLRDHIGANSPHVIAQSHTFVTYELDFQLQAQSGDLESWDDGYFTVQWSFYCGPKDRSSGVIYVGFETRVQVAEVLRWCRELEQLAA